jgi:AcrR family transcriptional regulator
VIADPLASPAAPSHVDPPGSAAATEDFRVREAAKKRERMRARLITATLDAFIDAHPGRVPVIDDVIRIAEVSRGTFYKYFDTLDDVLTEIGQRMAHEMLSSFEQIFDGVTDPAVRVAAGPLMATARAAMEPRHAAFISRVDFIEFLGGEDPRSRIVARSLTAARQEGAIKFASLDAAVDLVIGTSIEGARRMLKARSFDGAYVREVATMVMLGLGLPRKRAEQAVEASWQHLQNNSTNLHWWKPLSAG